MTDLEILKVYAAYETHDERGSHGEMIGVFTSRHVADQAAEKRGWYGGKGAVVEYSALSLDDGTVLLLKSSVPVPCGVDLITRRKEEIAAAKAKLTARELELLGIKP